MKKNILTIIIMAVVVINLVLTAVNMFVMLPTFKKTNNLINQVSSAVDLELEAANGKKQNYDMKDVEAYPITFDSKQTINLTKAQGDATVHYAVLESITLSFNKAADDYSDVKKLITANSVYVQDIVKEVISSKSVNDINEKSVKDEALAKIKENYGTDSIVNISLGGFLYN